MHVTTDGSTLRATAPASGRRSRWKRPTSSPAKCCASAALPPLPNVIDAPAALVRRDDQPRRLVHRGQQLVHAREELSVLGDAVGHPRNVHDASGPESTRSAPRSAPHPILPGPHIRRSYATAAAPTTPTVSPSAAATTSSARPPARSPARDALAHRRRAAARPRGSRRRRSRRRSGSKRFAIDATPHASASHVSSQTRAATASPARARRPRRRTPSRPSQPRLARALGDRRSGRVRLEAAAPAAAAAAAPVPVDRDVAELAAVARSRRGRARPSRTTPPPTPVETVR